MRIFAPKTSRLSHSLSLSLGLALTLTHSLSLSLCVCTGSKNARISKDSGVVRVAHVLGLGSNKRQHCTNSSGPWETGKRPPGSNAWGRRARYLGHFPGTALSPGLSCFAGFWRCQGQGLLGALVPALFIMSGRLSLTMDLFCSHRLSWPPREQGSPVQTLASCLPQGTSDPQTKRTAPPKSVRGMPRGMAPHNPQRRGPS